MKNKIKKSYTLEAFFAWFATSAGNIMITDLNKNVQVYKKSYFKRQNNFQFFIDGERMEKKNDIINVFED